MDKLPSLGIGGLPASASALIAGGVYLVAGSSPQLMEALLFANLPAANHGAMICSSERLPAPPVNTGWLDRCLASGRLLLLAPKPAGRSRPALPECLDELSRCRDQLRGAQDNLLLVLDHAENYLPLAKPQALRHQLQTARQWAASHGHRVLLLADSRKLNAATLALLHQEARDCAGLAHAQRAGDDAFSWQISHWLGDGAPEPALAYALERNADGALEARRDDDDLSLRPANDNLQVLATRASLSGGGAPSPLWQLHDDLPQLMDAARGAVAASVLLDTAGKQPRALAEAVAALRQQCGRRLKIAVREVGNRRLRQNEEQLLLRLGANIVLPAELRLSSVINLIQALQPAVFPLHPAQTTPQLHAASQPLDDRGYLSPRRFAAAVRETVERSRAIGILNTLVTLQPAQGISPREVLEQGRFQRAGDLCTADNEQVYLFLFACNAAGVNAALRHLFRLPVADLAESELRDSDADGILLTLSRLAERADLPDYSPALSEAEHAPPASPAAPARIPLRRAPLRRRDA